MDKKNISDYMTYLGAAISNCALYSPQHASVEEFSRKLLEVIGGLFIDDEFSLSILGESIIYNDIPVSDRSDNVSRFMKKIRIKGIEKIIFEKGVTQSEIMSFISTLASLDTPVSSSEHIKVGMLEVRHKIEGGFSQLMNESAGRVNEIYDGVSRFQRLDIRGLEEIVAGFITVLKKEINVLGKLSPIKSHDIYTYVHETNVALLTVFQAEALGLKGEALYDAGLAGLLHDIGKLFIPKEILNKKEVLNEQEWNLIKLHPVYGAAYLSNLPDVPKTTVIAAYEHHIRYNLSGYPRTKTRIRKQHFVSRLVAIADVYDALRTSRAYRSSIDVSQIIEIMKKESGSNFDPGLFDNFTIACRRVNAL